VVNKASDHAAAPSADAIFWMLCILHDKHNAEYFGLSFNPVHCEGALARAAPHIMMLA
jgi:hypothetical protein